MVGFPLTPSPLVTAMPLPAVMVRAVHVLDAVRAAMPVPETPSIAARSSASASVILPDEVIGEPETVIPAAGAVIPTLVTVPAPPVAESVPDVRERPEPRVIAPKSPSASAPTMRVGVSVVKSDTLNAPVIRVLGMITLSVTATFISVKSDEPIVT